MEENQKTKTLIVVLIVLILSIISALVFLTIKKPKNNSTVNPAPSVSTDPVQKQAETTPPPPATESAPIVYEKEAADPTVKQSEVIGKFISFDEKKSNIIVEVNGEQKTFNCSKGDCSRLDYLSIAAGEEIAKPAQMIDLKPESQVNVRFKEDGTALFVLIRK